MPAKSPGRARVSAAITFLAIVAVLLAACDVASSGASPTPTPRPTPTPWPSFVRPTPTPLPSFIVVTVAKGDTLTSIARRFSTTPRSIAFWNADRYPSLDPTSKGYDPNRLSIGWQLNVRPGVVVNEDDLPAAYASASPSTADPSPSASLTPAPSVTPTRAPSPTPTPATGTVSSLLSHGSRSSKQIALTFDMGGRLTPALDIMDWLIAHEVHATIFPTGKTASTTTTGAAVLARIKAHPELFVVGNHSWDHPYFTTLSSAQMLDQLDRTEQVVRDLAGRSTKPWFRPPYGAQNLAIRTVIGRAGWAYTVMWDVDTIDWKPESDGGPTTDAIVTKVVTRAQGGSIVLMHLGAYNTFEALPRLVDGLRARGLQPVTLDELLGR